MAFSIMTLSITTFSISTFSIMTLRITIKSAALSILTRCITALETVMLSIVYTDCRKKPLILSVIMLNVVMLSVVAPTFSSHETAFNFQHDSLKFVAKIVFNFG